jgi:hypothetical protein
MYVTFFFVERESGNGSLFIRIFRQTHLRKITKLLLYFDVEQNFSVMIKLLIFDVNDTTRYLNIRKYANEFRIDETPQSPSPHVASRRYRHKMFGQHLLQ